MMDLKRKEEFENVGTFIVLRRKTGPEELLAYVDCLWKITYWKYLPLIVQCNCYMTDGNSGVYHVKYNKRMPTVWAKSPDVRFFLFLG